jgi:putative ABC transport system substrate-binding protein
MKRREFIAILGSAATWPMYARAKMPTGDRVWHLGYLSPAGGASGMALFGVFKDRMQQLGYVLEKDLRIEYRSAEGDYSRLPAFAVELVSLTPDVLVGANSAATAPLQRATSSIPSVMCTTGDPVGDGFIASFAKPGGNITGMSSQSAELTSKALELLHIAVPNAKRIAILTSPAPQHKLMLKDAYAAAEPLRLEIMPVMARTPADFDEAFATMHTKESEALLVLADPRIEPKLVQLSDKWRLPTIYQATGFIEIGGMLSYSANTSELFRGAATYVDKILNGAKPADLPVELPTRFKLQANLKTANSLGVTIPDSILARADKVIE